MRPSHSSNPVTRLPLRPLQLLPMLLLLLGLGGDGSAASEPERAAVGRAASRADASRDGSADSRSERAAVGRAASRADASLKTAGGTSSVGAAAALPASTTFDDGDTVDPSVDNCPFVRNRYQLDSDGNGYGDVCECGDASGDGRLNTTDARLVQRCALGSFGLNASGGNNCPFALCDVNGDEVCDSADASVIQDVVLGAVASVDLLCAQRLAPTAAQLAADSDADGLSDAQEIYGWTIEVDTLGLGASAQLTQMDVQSASLGTDTDGDGLDDYTEFLIRSDPSLPDTDGDSLTDGAEWYQWLSSPTSVDTDGDARGPNGNLPPNARLFDGFELDPSVGFRTSPTLADTDGDGKTDYEEIDDPSRSPLIAELPEYTLTQVGDVDIRLNVQFAEAVGEESQYGTQASTSETTSQSRGGSDQWSINASFSATFGSSATVGVTGGVTGVGGNASATVSNQFSASTGFGAEHTTTWTEDSSQTFQEQYSQYATDTLTKTETAASGSISMGLVIENTGLSTFEISTMAVTVLQLQRSPQPTFKTLATLLPAVEGVTLAPGEKSGVIQVASRWPDNLNAAVVKEFLKNPSALTYDTSSIELVDAQGINFDFVKENVFPRTAVVSVDYGDGRLERYRVATNVERAPDSSFLGVSMNTVLAEILGIDFATDPVPATSGTTLSRIEATADAVPIGKWANFLSSERTTPPSATFEDITIWAGDEISLGYLQDRDVDGLVDRLEEMFGSLDAIGMADTDGDGLTDFQEVVQGWTVNFYAPGGPHRDPSVPMEYRVFSDPRSRDGDGDGLPDNLEYGWLDPQNPDTDGDGFSDGDESANCFLPGGCGFLGPLAARQALPILYVDAACRLGPGGNCGTGDGESWANAYGELHAGLAEARDRALSLVFARPTNEIWVAQGLYKPLSGSTVNTFDLVEIPAGNIDTNYLVDVPVNVYGGFLGMETKRDQRIADPLFNGTELSGDQAGNDLDNFGNYADNNTHVVQAFGVTSGLDGFVISGGNGVVPNGYGGGMDIYASDLTLANLQVRLNRADKGGGINVENSTVTLENSILFRNRALLTDGGGMNVEGAGGSSLTLVNVSFFENEAALSGGGLEYSGFNEDLLVQDSLFENNVANTGLTNGIGGGARIDVSATVIDTEFRGNEVDGSGGGGGLAFVGLGGEDLVLAQSVFSGNLAPSGSGVYLAASDFSDIRMHVINCSFGGNSDGLGGGSALELVDALMSNELAGYTTVENSIFAGNGNGSETGQIEAPPGSTRVTVRKSCIEGPLSQFSGLGNVDQSASEAFVDAARGNLRLKPTSLCVDAGTNLVDFDPRTSGFQTLPAFDLDGNERVVDGDGDGNAVVDTGAYEVQAP